MLQLCKGETFIYFLTDKKPGIREVKWPAHSLRDYKQGFEIGHSDT